MPLVDNLFGSVQRGDLNRLITLLRKYPDAINYTEENGMSLLHYSLLLEQMEVVIFLTNSPNCDLTIQEKLYGHTPLHLVCFYGQSRLAQLLITKLKPDQLNIQDKMGWTPLHHAARCGSIDLCKMLMVHQCKIDIKNKRGITALHYAARHGYTDVLTLLYDYVRPKFDPSSMSVESFAQPIPSLLHMAALHNQAETVEWLKNQLYPPAIKCQRILHQNASISVVEFPDDTAAARGHHALKSNLASYRVAYKTWVADLTGDHQPLDHVKLCVLGASDCGKTSLLDSLGAINLSTTSLLSETEEEKGKEKGKRAPTRGIEISQLRLSNHETFHAWDFAGQVEQFIAHNFFLTTENTAYVLVLDLSKPVTTLHYDLLWWFTLVHSHNLGQAPFYEESQATDIALMRPLIQTRSRQISRVSGSPHSSHRSRINSASGSLAYLRPPKPSKSHRLSPPSSPVPSHRRTPSPINPSSPTFIQNFFSSSFSPSSSSTIVSPPTSPSISSSYALTPVPILIVGTHCDKISESDRADLVANMEELIREASKSYQEYLDIIPQLFLANLSKPQSFEIKKIKEQLILMRTALMENQYLYPRIFDKVAKKIEALQLGTGTQKLMSLSELHHLIAKDVNRIVSESQLAFILKTLNNTGLLVYINQGILSQSVFIDPNWLCQDVLGQAFASLSSSSSDSSYILTTEQIQTCLQSVCTDAYHSSKTIVIKTLQDFDMCYSLRDKRGYYAFPHLIQEEITEESWKQDSQYIGYIGRRLVCVDTTSFLPPGFFSRLQVQLALYANKEKVTLFKRSIVLDSGKFQCLIQIDSSSTSIDMIGRIKDSRSAQNCLQILDQVQNIQAKLNKVACPSIFFKLEILSASDLAIHASNVHAYNVQEVVRAEREKLSLMNLSGVTESPSQLLYFGQEELQRHYSGKNTKIAFLPDEMFEKLELLMNGEDDKQDWRALARQINLSEYIAILVSKANPAQMLLLKWGEKPRWTVDSLLYALQAIDRKDVHTFVRARTDIKYK